MSIETATDGRIRFARRWEVPARWVIFGAIAGILAGGILEQFWIALVVVFLAMPAAWIFNLRCPNCGWLVYRLHGTAKSKYAKDQFLAPLYSKQVWKAPYSCSKCGLAFLPSDFPSKADNAQTH